MPDSAPFGAFARTLVAISQQSGRHAKADRLGAFLDDLDDDDLARTARWASGRLFPLADQRTVGVGHAALLSALTAATETERDDLRASLVRLGDPGDVAAAAIGERPPSGWTLDRAEAFVETLAETTGSRARTALVADALSVLGPDEARILVRLLAGDLRIGMQEGGVEGTLVRLFERDAAAVRRATMLTGDIGETAVLARHDRLAEARFRPFHPVRFMLATAAEASDERTLADEVARQLETPVAIEDKFDGIRAQAHVALDRPPEPEPGVEHPQPHGVVAEGASGSVRVALFSRTLDALTASFPDLVGPLAALAAGHPDGLVLDGEIVPLTADRRIAPFQTLQARLGRKTVSDAMQAETPVGLVVYDVLAADGTPLFEVPFRERQAVLDTLGLPSARDPFADRLARSHIDLVDDLATLDDRFDAARARGNEGLMVKALGAPYTPGRRGRDWLKVKKALATLDVVVTSVEVGSGGRRHLLSDVTFAVRRSDDDPTLLTVGKAYSGLTDAELTELTAWFKAHTRETFAHGRVRTVDPEIVLEVAFDNVQVSPRHKSGYALRFPRIVRLRPDKPVAEIDTLASVAALAAPA